jgi:hypothetical protein
MGSWKLSGRMRKCIELLMRWTVNAGKWYPRYHPGFEELRQKGHRPIGIQPIQAALHLSIRLEMLNEPDQDV